jgi:hypothetical protein
MILSAFAAFCEGFAGIEAFTQAWSKYFHAEASCPRTTPEQG